MTNSRRCCQSLLHVWRTSFLAAHCGWHEVRTPKTRNSAWQIRFPEMDAVGPVGPMWYHASWFTPRWTKDAFDFASLLSRISLTGIGPQCKRCSELICHLSRFAEKFWESSFKLPCFLVFSATTTTLCAIVSVKSCCGSLFFNSLNSAVMTIHHMRWGVNNQDLNRSACPHELV